MVAIDRKLLCEVTILCGCPHKLVADPDADIGPRHLALLHLGIDESPRVGVLDGDREHQCTPSSILRHLPRGIAEAFHERHQSRRGKGGVVDRSALGTDLAQVVAYASAPLHELHLLLVESHDGPVGVGVAVDTDDEAVGERGNLMVIADARHRAARGNDISEVVEKGEYLLGREGVGVVGLYPGYLVGDAPVHVGGSLLIDMTHPILHGVLAHPDAGSECVAVEIVQGGLVGLLKGICLFFLHTVKFFNQIAKLQILFRLWKKTRRFFVRWYGKDGQRGAIEGCQPPRLEAPMTTSSPQFPIEPGKKHLRMAEDSDKIRKFVR